MLRRPNRAIEKFRITEGSYASRRGELNGAFQVDFIRIISSDGGGYVGVG